MTDAELVLLSLVAERPQHAYEIQEALESRRVRQWAAIGYSSVFLVLGKLEEEGLLTGQETAGAHPSVSRRYEVTDAGWAVLQTAIADRLSTPREPGGGFLLGLATLHHLRAEQVRHALDSYEAQLRDRLAEINQRRVEQIEEADEEPPLQVVALYDYSLTLIVAELEWLVEFRQAWEAQAPPALPRRPAFRTPVFRDAATRPAAADRTKPHVGADDADE